MRSFHKAKHLLAHEPGGQRHQVIEALLLSLEQDTRFRLNDLYLLSEEDFQLALSIMQEWQLDRYYLGKAKLFHGLDKP